MIIGFQIWLEEFKKNFDARMGRWLKPLFPQKKKVSENTTDSFTASKPKTVSKPKKTQTKTKKDS